jgi:hypothetical protein
MYYLQFWFASLTIHIKLDQSDPFISLPLPLPLSLRVTFSIHETISIYDLKRQIHVSLKMFSSYFNIIINARINTVQPDLGDFSFWGNLKNY